jgi:superfamily II DNA or RNA helicase
MPVAITPRYEDPFFFDNEALQAIVPERMIAAGLRFYREHRVMEIDQSQERLWAYVEDEKDDEPYRVTMDLDEAGNLVLDCECPESREGVCGHQVAALCAYADQKDEEDQILTAADTAIKDRIKRARTEVNVKHLSGKPWFGDWEAVSSGSATHYSQRYRVTIRSLRDRTNICSCPDFLNNQLGTCKHIEAVLHKLAKRRDRARIRKLPPPASYVYLAWDVEDAPRICVRRAPSVAGDLASVVDRLFDARGRFTGRLPDDFFRFTDQVAHRTDMVVGEDALDFGNRMATDTAHRARTEKIQNRIMATRGRLPGVKARLYPYQVEGAAFLAGTGRALLADDMGLGKTLQAIAAAAWLRTHEGARKTLIICPASLKQQWAREIAKFTDLDTQIIQGPPRERSAQYQRDAAFFVINYELILRDRTVIIDTLAPDLVIMDEAQRIKNWRTKIASAVKTIPCRYAFVLTGTPLENRLEDLYSLMQVVDSKVLGPLWRYMVDFHVTDARDKVLGYRNLALLRRRMAPVMLRRDRRLVRDQLPERITQRLDVIMTAEQVDLHDAAMSSAGTLANIAKKRPLTPSEQNRLMAALQQARMACDAAGLVDKKTKGAPKLDELALLLEELCVQSGLKVVVFSQWEQMTRMVVQRLEGMKLGYVRLHGGVPTAKRGALMDSFRDDDAVRVFVSTDAGGVGLNLQSASVVINLDVPWNPAVLEQRNARVHRLGQSQQVQIITMVAAGGYEEQVLGLVQTKQNLFDNVIGEDAAEDVVGVSKKMLEALIENLAEEEPAADAGDGPKAAEPEKETGEAVPKAPGPAIDPALDAAITRCIDALQQSFGTRIDRIFASAGGLFVVLDQVDAAADKVAEGLSADIPVALIDPLAFKGLQRLGAASPLAGARSCYNAADNTPADGLSRLRRMADEKLKAARVLLDQSMAESALDLVVAALLSAASDMAGKTAPVPPQEAGVWLFGEAVPAGVIDSDEAGLIMKSIGLAQGKMVPDNLVDDLVQEASRFING